MTAELRKLLDVIQGMFRSDANIEQVRESVIIAGERRLRPGLITTATTVLYCSLRERELR